MEKLQINKKSTALLVMHWMESNSKNLAPAQKAEVLGNLKRAIGAARKAGVPVIYALVRFRDGYPEVSPKIKKQVETKEAGKHAAADPEVRICDEIRPNPGEVVVINTHSSAFTGSDLELILRAKGIDALMLTGLSTLGTVLATTLDAVNKDYQVYVIGDCCADRNLEKHKMWVTQVLPQYTTVCSTDDFIASIS